MIKLWLRVVMPACLLLALGARVQAATNLWNGSVNQDWFNANNWSLISVPAAGDDVIITNAGANVLLTNSTAWLASFTLTNKTLVFSNWATALYATNVLIRNNGWLTLPGVFTNGVMSNRVYVVCSNFTLEAGGIIHANSNGFFGNEGPGCGSGGPGWYGSGGAYGGRGGISLQFTGGVPYGSLSAPVDLGSGGGNGTLSGANGGGAIRLEAAGLVNINGTVRANGSSTPNFNVGGGAGGSIFITCRTFIGGAQGRLQVDGGPSGYYNYSGAGGGGRIALVYTNGSASNGFSMSAAGSAGHADAYNYSYNLMAGNGTVYLSDTGFLSETLSGNLFTNVNLFIPNFKQWTVNQLTVSNCSVTFINDGFGLAATGNVLIATNGHLGIGPLSGVSNAWLACGGNLILTNGGKLSVYSGTTNGTAWNYGALVSVTGDLRVSSGAWIYPFCHTIDGSAVKFQMRNLWITGNNSNQGFDAYSRGFGQERGPGVNPVYGGWGAGAGHGGRGGASASAAGGPAYGVTNAPLLPGSGANHMFGGSGGGLIWIEAQDTLSVNGMLRATGGYGGSGAGGGAGGSIFMVGRTLLGTANSRLEAPGGDGGHFMYSGGGGGGRIAVWFGAPITESIRAALLAGQVPRSVVVTNQLATFAGTISVTNGIGGTGYYSPASQPGTVVFFEYCPPPAGTVMRIF